MMKLLVVCSEMEHIRVVHALNLAVRQDQRNDVVVWTWRDGSELVDDFEESVFWSDVPPDIHVIVTKAVTRLPRDLLDEIGCFVQVVSREGFFPAKPQRLERFLETLKLCWTDQANEAYESYDHRSPQFGVMQWLQQFDEVGAPDLGKALLRHLYVMPTDECVALLVKSFATEFGKPSDLIATLSRLGKSGAALSGGLRRGLPRDPVVLTEAIESAGKREEKVVIHVFEDGLWTGIELSRVIDSLMGTAIKPKLPALSNTALIYQYEIVLHFSLVTDIGICAARSLLSELKLGNMSLATADSKMIEVLSDDAKTRFENGEFTFRHVQEFSPEILVVPSIISQLRTHLDEGSISHMAEVIRKIGAQLWTLNNNLSSDQDVPLNVEFGANGIGSTILFRHSSPRAVLPMFWATGPVKWGKRRINWKALFPENGPHDHDAFSVVAH
jgi:hypothetical protein